MGTPNKPCQDCPFSVENTGTLDMMFVDQMHSNSIDIQGFPCHMRHPDSDIMTCPSHELNANDCVGYKWMLENLKSNSREAHPEVVVFFDDLMKC